MRAFALAAVTAPFVVAPAAEADPLGVPLRIADFPAFEMASEDPSIAAGNGRLLVVYERTRTFQGTVDRGVFAGDQVVAQLVEPSGAPVGDPVVVDAEDIGHQTDPDVVYNATRNEYFVVWRRDDAEFGGFRGSTDQIIRARRLSADGQPLGSNLELGGDYADEVRVAWSSTEDEYLAVWEEDSDDDVFGREVDGDGTVGGAVLELTADSVDDAEDPDVGHDPVSNRWLLAYEADSVATPERGSSEEGVYGQVFDAAAEPVTDIFIIDAANQRRATAPSIAGRSAGGFRVAYSADPAPETAREIWTRDVAADGSVATEADQVSPSVEGEPEFADSIEPSISHDPAADEYLVAWNYTGFFSSRSAAPNNAIFGRRQSAAGDALGAGEANVSQQELLGEGIYSTADVVTAYDRSSCTFTTAWEGQAPFEGATLGRIDGETLRQEVFTRGFDGTDCKVAEQKVEQTVTPGATPPPAAGSAASQGAPPQAFGRPPRRCLSRRNFTATIRIKKGLSFRSVTASLDGKALDVEPEGRSLPVPVDLRGKAPGIYVLRVTARLSNGRTLRVTRRYRACAVGSTTRLVRVDP